MDRDALAARSGTWDIARESMSSAGVMCALIFVAVVPWLVFQFIWSIVIVVPVIVGYALFLSGRLLRGGGTIDRGFDAADAMIEPLGLDMTARPKVEITSRMGQPGYDAGLRGAAVFAGERHGRRVEVRTEGGGGSRTTVAGPVAEFEARLREGPPARPPRRAARGRPRPGLALGVRALEGRDRRGRGGGDRRQPQGGPRRRVAL